MNHKLRMLISIAIVAIALGGCASTKQSDMARDHLKAQAQFEKAEAERKAKANEVLKSQISDWPAWATEQPSNGPAGIYAVGMASSSDPSIALRKAKLKAEFELAQSVRQEISGQERQADLDDGFADVRSEYELLVDRFVASVPLRGHQVVEQHLTVSEGKAYAFILYRMSQDVLTSLIDQKRDEWAGLSSKQAFDSLEQRIKVQQSSGKEISS